ncbi:MAG: hypothetical protein CMG55_10470 [Candidatus Marinimicrobia bacterium]|nr:hypothetical protein [Candidatus Neomarinimicrobiota bacterium]|tara:strand:- start:323 stop:706 length:384 start_codon:yes stop_codon:yes gene_type:complete
MGIEMKNVLGTELKPCSLSPITGYYRDGFCRTDHHDTGRHTVASIMTEDFLNFTSSRGNDLSTPNIIYGFPGLKVGDRWCLCALRWKEAYEAGFAPPVILEATHERTLDFIDLKVLIEKSKSPQNQS